MVIVLLWLLAATTVPAITGLKVVPAGEFPIIGRVDMASVYDGADHIWILGGYGAAAFNEIFRYNLLTEELELMSRFPHVTVYSGSAHMDANGDIYYVGGMWYDYDGYMKSRWVWKLNATSPTPTIVAHLPERHDGGCTYFDGQSKFWTVGGISRGNAFGDYEPNFFHVNAKDNTSEIIVPQIPVLRAVSPCGQFGDHMFVFGGYNNEMTPPFLNTILKIHPEIGGVEVLNVTLRPSITHSGSAVVVGDEVYIIGGGDSDTGIYNDITKFNRLTEEIVTLTPQGWKPGLTRTSSVYVPSLHRIYVFGGYSNKFEREIIYIQLDPK